MWKSILEILSNPWVRTVVVAIAAAIVEACRDEGDDERTPDSAP